MKKVKLIEYITIYAALIQVAICGEFGYRITSVDVNDKGRVDRIGIIIVQIADEYMGPTQVFVSKSGVENAGSPNMRVKKDGDKIVVSLDLDVTLHEPERPFFTDGKYIWKLVEVSSELKPIEAGSHFIPVVTSENQVIGFGLDNFAKDKLLNSIYKKMTQPSDSQ